MSECPDCGNPPRARGKIELEDGKLATCTSKFHANLVVREAGAYEYLSENFETLHSTSVPMTDKEALEYFSLIKVWFPLEKPCYITRRELDGREFKMMPWRYDNETGRVEKIETTQES